MMIITAVKAGLDYSPCVVLPILMAQSMHVTSTVIAIKLHTGSPNLILTHCVACKCISNLLFTVTSKKLGGFKSRRNNWDQLV